MAVTHKVWRFLACACLAAMLGFVAACGDDDGAIPSPGDTDEGGTITGRVTDSSTGNGIVGATVGTSPASTIALTDAQGNFTINNVPSGSTTVTATAGGFNSDAIQVVVVEDGSVTANLELDPSGAVGDTVGTVSGIVLRRDGSPLAGAAVDIVQGGSCDTGTVVTTATTDDGGGFLVEDLAPGTYLACVTTTIGGQDFTGRAGFIINAGELTSVSITVGRDADQTTEPNVGGEAIELDENGNFDGIIQFVDFDADGTDDQDCNIIFTQHLWVVQVVQDLNDDGVADADEPLVSGVRVEWSLNQGPGIIVSVPGPDQPQGNTGVIVDSDDPFLDPVEAESAKAAANGVSPQFIVDATHAVTYTNDADETLDFNGDTENLLAGQTWIVVTSPTEGFTDVVAFSPDLARDAECTILNDGTPDGDVFCPDKDFAVKRWVNWRIEVAELTAGDTSGGFPTDSITANIVADGDTIVNRLDRTPQFAGGAATIDCAFPAVPDGTECDLSNRAFIGIVISRLRQDSPFTFTTGDVNFAVIDDSPDVDIEDIDSDEALGTTPAFTGGDASADDVEGTEANGTPGDNLAMAPFDMDEEVTFQCEIDPDNLDQCIDIDVDDVTANSAGQTLADMGFTITPGSEDEESAVAVTVALDSTVFTAFASDSAPQGFIFSDELQALIDGQADDTSAFSITILDEFGEVCEEIEIGKRWVTSVIQIVKAGPITVGFNRNNPADPADDASEQFIYTVTVINDGETESTNVIIADTLPILDGPDPTDTPGDRDGDQAFRYVTDRPTFDPDGVRYYIDNGDNEDGTSTDVCFEAPTPLPAAFPTPALCTTTLAFATIPEARAAAEDASADGDQVVIVEYFDLEVLARTQPGGDVEAEDSFEITLETIQSVNDFPLDLTGLIPERDEENGEWCNIATVTTGENDFAADSVCTRVVEGLLEIRKTVQDAVVPSGDLAIFDVELANNGSESLLNVVVTDTLDAPLEFIRIDNLCAGCTSDSTSIDTTGTAVSILTFTVPELPVTDTDGDGFFDDDEGFLVATVVAQTPNIAGTFCNRVTVADSTGGRTDSDLACVTTLVEIEFDITNEDGLLAADSSFTDVEVFNVGDTVAYETRVSNVDSTETATNVVVTYQIAAESGILQFLASVIEDTPNGEPIICDPSGGPTGSGECTVTVATLPPGEAIAFTYTTIAEATGNDVNRVILDANELTLTVENEEPTTVNP